MSGKTWGQDSLNHREGRLKAGGTKREAYVARLYAVIEDLADGSLHKDEDIRRIAIVRHINMADDKTAVAAFLRTAALTPWIRFERNAEGTRFTIDRELKAICEARAPRPQLGGMHPTEFLQNLAGEIDRRRKENREKRNTSKWNPDSINKLEQSKLLDWIEYELKKLLATAESDRESDKASQDLTEIREKTHVSEEGCENRALDA